MPAFQSKSGIEDDSATNCIRMRVTKTIAPMFVAVSWACLGDLAPTEKTIALIKLTAKLQIFGK